MRRKKRILQHLWISCIVQMLMIMDTFTFMDSCQNMSLKNKEEAGCPNMVLEGRSPLVLLTWISNTFWLAEHTWSRSSAVSTAGEPTGLWPSRTRVGLGAPQRSPASYLHHHRVSISSYGSSGFSLNVNSPRDTTPSSEVTCSVRQMPSFLIPLVSCG